MLRLSEQFRVLGQDGEQHMVACFLDSYKRPTETSLNLERVEIRRYRLDGIDELERVDDDTFRMPDGRLLRRCADE
jgi:hypothetical protein